LVGGGGAVADCKAKAIGGVVGEGIDGGGFGYVAVGSASGVDAEATIGADQGRATVSNDTIGDAVAEFGAAVWVGSDDCAGDVGEGIGAGGVCVAAGGDGGEGWGVVGSGDADD
jgi:hypothetical protein